MLGTKEISSKKILEQKFPEKSQMFEAMWEKLEGGRKKMEVGNFLEKLEESVTKVGSSKVGSLKAKL